MKKKTLLVIVKWIAIALVLLVAVFVGIGLAMHEPRPEAEEGPAADAMARQLMAAVDSAAWDSTGAVSWVFAGRHRHVWDRDRDYAKVEWGEFEVLVNLQTREGVALRNGQRVAEGEADLVNEAWKRWVNDAFWLNPVVKLFDPGTRRGLVELKDGRSGVMVTYTSGGATPGDSYLWLPGGDGLPESWKMWVSIIPVGGLEVSWENWLELETGAKVAQTHRGDLPFTLELSDIQGAASLAQLTGEADPFALLEAQ